MESRAESSRGARNLVALRPALPVAGLFMAGVVLHRWLPHRPPVWIALAILLTLLAVVTLRRRAVNSLVVAAGIVSIGIAAAQLYAYQFRTDEITLFAGDTPRL